MWWEISSRTRSPCCERGRRIYLNYWFNSNWRPNFSAGEVLLSCKFIHGYIQIISDCWFDHSYNKNTFLMVKSLFVMVKIAIFVGSIRTSHLPNPGEVPCQPPIPGLGRCSLRQRGTSGESRETSGKQWRFNHEHLGIGIYNSYYIYIYLNICICIYL